RVINRRGNALRLQFGRQRITPPALDADGVLSPNRGHAWRHAWDDDDVVQAFVVAPGNRVSGINLIRENFQFLDQNGGLNRVEARRQADAYIVVFVTSLPMHAQTAHCIGQPVVIGHHRATIPVATEWLGREKTRRGAKPECTQATIVTGRPTALRRIVENEQIVGGGGRPDGGVIGWQAKQIDRDNRFWIETSLSCGLNGARYALYIDIEGRCIDVKEYRSRTDQRRHFCRRAERERRTQHRVARSNAHGAQSKHKGISSTGTRDDVTGTTKRSEIAFERPHFRAENELAMIQHAGNRVIDGGAQAPPLSGNVNKWDRWQIGTQVHGTPVNRTAVSQRRRAGLFVWRARPRSDAWRGNASQFQGLLRPPHQ